MIAISLTGVMVSLLLVGLVSGTPVRHCIQVLPGVLALVAAVRRTAWAKDAALPVFLVWLVLMILIWLFLLGLARILTGTFSAAEIALTITTGVSCAIGLWAWLRMPSSAGVTRRAIVSTIFALLQIAALWVSLRPSFNRM